MTPISGSPISSLGGAAPPPLGDPELASGCGCYDENFAVLLNVLEDAIAASLPRGDALITNVLETEGVASTAALGSVRMRATASDAALLTLDNASQILSVIKDRVVAASDFDCLGRFRSGIASGGAFQDSVAAAWGMLLAGAASAQDDATAMVRKLAALADTLQALGNVHGKLSALAAVAVAATLEARVSAGWSAAVVDQAALVDEARNTLAAMVAAEDAAALVDTTTPSLRLVLLTEDSATVAGDPVTTLRAIDELADGAVLYCALRLGGVDYQGWVLNTQLRAVTEYRNVPFDSFAILGGRTYAAGDGGIFEMTGDTDNGQQIEAWFRPFLTNFGTQKMKRVTDVWLGTSSTGLFVKVHTKNPRTGEMEEDIYPVEHFHGDGADKGRVRVGRGLTSNWWTLTVSNVAGAAFEVDTIEWHPLVLDRRQ